MNTVIPFNFNNSNLRAVQLNGQPWFVAKDACQVLGLTDDRNHLMKLDGDERRFVARSNVNLTDGVSFPNRGANCISESGLYKLIMRSDKPEAKPFQNWITQVVLPTIRKDGAYVMGEEKVATGEMSEDELVLRAQQILMSKVERLKAERGVAQAKVVATEPKGLVFDTSMGDKTMSVSRFARSLPPSTSRAS